MLTLNKKVKKIIMLIFFILAFYCIKSNAVVKPTSNFYVNDYANVLSAETERYILQTNIDLNSKTKAQIVVVTVTSLDGKSIEEYATELFREFGIGDKEKNNGVLLLCSTGDRLFRIEVGYGLEGALPDGKTGRIQDQYIIPYLKNNNYDEGIKNGFSSVLEEVCKEYGITLMYAKKPNSIQNSGYFQTEILYTTTIISFIVITLLSLFKIKTVKIIKYIYVFLSPIIVYIIFKNLLLAFSLFIVNILCIISFFFHFRIGRWIFWWPEEASLVAGGGFSGGRRFFTEEDGSTRGF